MPEGVERLGGSLVRRTPTRADLAARRPLLLTDRDLDILVAVYQHGFLTPELVQLAFYSPDPGGSRAASSSASQRLRQLWLWRILERVERPVNRGLGGSEPYLYAIGRRAVPWVARKLSGTPGRGGLPVGHRRLDRLNPQFIDHDLYAARLWANLARLLRGTRVRSWHWVDERALRGRKLRVRDPRGSRPLPFLPDGYFEVVYGTPEVTCASPHPASSTGGGPDGGAAAEAAAAARQRCLVEIDMGRLTIARFRRKVRSFELALEGGLFLEEFGRGEFEVLVVTRGEKRLRHLMRAALAEVPPDRRGWYSFATFDILRPEQFGGPAWLTLEGEHVGLLYDRESGGTASADAAGAPGAGAA